MVSRGGDSPSCSSLLLGLGGVFRAPQSAHGQATYSESVAWAINDAGVMVGLVVADGDELAVSWEIERFVVLPSLADGGGSGASGINSGGQIVGQSESETGEMMPVIWDHGEVTALRTLGTGPTSGGFARDINDLGQIVGASWTSENWGAHAVSWQDGAITDLGCLPGDVRCVAVAINGRGQIVGWSETPAGESHPVLWQDGHIAALGTLSGDPYGAAIDINDRGQIVGFSDLGRRELSTGPLARWRAQCTPGPAWRHRR